MKIGLFSYETPPDIGGGHIFRDELEKAATQLKGRHQFVMVNVPPPTTAYRIRRRLRAHLDPSLYTSPPVSETLRAEVARLELDLLWFNHAEPVYLGLPYVLNIFDLQHRLQPWFPEVSANGEWEHRESYLEKATKRAAMITVGSREAKDQLCHFYGVFPDNVHVLPLPTPQRAIDLALGKSPTPTIKNIREKYGIKNEFLFYPAQFWPHKNHANLLHALKILKDQKGTDISLVLTGSDQGNLSHIQSVAKDLGLTDNVHFCGFVPHEDVMAFYREALALSFVSFFGPENLPPLEAMALGCPVILSDIPGVRDLFDDVPILVNPRSPQSIADGIEGLLQNPGQIPERVEAGKRIAIRNDASAYFAQFQDMLDGFETIRRCWP